MTRKELALEIARIQKEKLNLKSSVEVLANGYLKGCGAVKAHSKAELEEVLKIVSK